MRKTYTFKHIIVAFIVGAFLMSSGQVLADKVTQIGNKVSGEAAVYVNGKRVSDAVIIKDKSYVPGRDIAEALGANVEWKGADGIVITSENSIDWDKIQKISKVKASINGAKSNIERLQEFIEKYNEEHLSQYSENVRVVYEQEVDRSKQELEEEKAKLAQYEAELEELESTK